MNWNTRDRFSRHGRPSPVAEYQGRLAADLWREFGPYCPVTPEWAIAGGDALWRRPRPHPWVKAMYEPRVDVAVGPFAVDFRAGDEYDRLVEYHRPLLVRLLAAHGANVEAFGSRFPAAHFDDAVYSNHNARCLLAIEVERGNGVAKYLMGSAFNAASLGRLGILVCWDDVRLRDLLGLREYLCFLASVEKNTFSSRNMLVLHRAQMDAALGEQ